MRPYWRINRGVSGFDSMGHGHYFANYPNSNTAQPSLQQNNPHQQAPPRPLQSQGGHHETSGHSQHHSYDSDSLSHGNSAGSNGGKGSYDNNWHYINTNDQNSAHHGSHGQSHSYGQSSQDKDTTQR